MTSIAHTSRVRWRKSSIGVDDAGRAFTLASRPRGLVSVGLAALLVSAWGGIVPFIGPTFSFTANNTPAWHWSNMHLWLHVVPGVVGIVFGLVVLSGVPKAWRARGRAMLGFAGLVLIACGAWFVLAPQIWPIISSGQVFAPQSDAMTNFLAWLGYNLGPGVVLAALGGMALKSARADKLGKEPAVAPFDTAGETAPGQAADETVGSPMAGSDTRYE